ncbi:MAG: hypothetical protein FJZ01_05630 [Candidatus Sericytochromatia bacterium]|nr:hypothetical protein [Candidatus Tanganyikabacteria bacterium]
MIAHALLAFSLAVGGGSLTTPADALKHDHHAGHEQHHSFTGPLAKGLEAFHDSLRPLWHDAFPKKDYGSIKRKVPELKAKAAALAAVPLPPGARAKRSQRDKLVKAVSNLDAAKQDDKKFAKAFEEVHEAFHALAEASGGH